MKDGRQIKIIIHKSDPSQQTISSETHIITLCTMDGWQPSATKPVLANLPMSHQLYPSSPVQMQVFAQMATLGTGGSFDEMGRRAVFRALTEPLQSTDNAGFYRDEASLHVVVISDEDDSSGVSRRALGSSPSSPR